METKRKAVGPIIRESLVSAWNGEAKKTFYVAFWLPVSWALWGACLILAAHSYPGYHISNHDISFLAEPDLNPKGWWFCRLGWGIAAMMMFPPVAYLSRRMKELTLGQDPCGRRLVSLGSICMRWACLGLLGLAFAPFDALHVTSGVFAMGGMYMPLLVLWFVPLFKAQKMSLARLTLFAISAWWGVVGFLTTQGYRFFAYGELGHDFKHRSENFFLRFSLWEWMLFLGGTTSFVILVAVLPSKAETAE